MPSQPRRHACSNTISPSPSIVFVEHDAGMRGADELRQLALAMLDWPAAQILALQLDQIEGAKHGVTAMTCPANQLEHGHALFVGDDRLAVDQERAAGKGRDRRRGERKPRCEIVAVASEEPDAGSVTPSHNAEAVVLDLVNPVSPGRRPLGG